MGGLVIKGPNGSDAVTLQQSINVTKVVEASDIASDAFVKGRIGTGGGFSFRNKIIDGRFDFWYDEGTTQSTSGYGSDTMWQNVNTGSTKVHSQQPLIVGVDLPAIEVPSAKYFSRTVVTSVAGANNGVWKQQTIESVGTLAGKTVTLSFYARADSTKNIGIEFNQNFGSGGSASISFGHQLVSLSNIWKRYSINVSIPSLTGKTVVVGTDGLLCRFWFDAGSNFAGNSSNLGQQSGTFDIACIQLEEGSVATQFEELPIDISKCRLNRYFEQGILFVPGYSVVGNSIGAVVKYSVQKRVLPSISLAIQSPSNCSTLVTTSSDTNQVGIHSQVLVTGVAQFWCSWLADARL